LLPFLPFSAEMAVSPGWAGREAVEAVARREDGPEVPDEALDAPAGVMRLVDRVIVDQLQRELRHNPEASAGGNQPRPHLRVGRARERVDLRCGRLTPFRRNFVYLYGEPLTP
jgi:hypothetical protein